MWGAATLEEPVLSLRPPALPPAPFCCFPMAAIPATSSCFFQRNKVSFYFTLPPCARLFLCLLVSSLSAQVL